MSRRIDASWPSGGLRVATGVYTGDGAATEAITGVGFQPRFIIVYAHDLVSAANMPWGLKTDGDGIMTSTYFQGASQHRYQSDDIISLDADGFTVGDGTGFTNLFNAADIEYSYMCFG